MLKDVVVNLTPSRPQDPAVDYAISLASQFGAHLTGVAFALEPAIPASAMGGIAGDVIDNAIAEAQQQAKDAVARFETATKKQGVLSEKQMITALVADAVSALARSHGISTCPSSCNRIRTPTPLTICSRSPHCSAPAGRS